MSENTTKSVFVEGVGHFEAKYQVEGLRFQPTSPIYTVRYGNGSTITLSLEVFTQKNFVADFIRLNLNFYFT